MEAFIDESIDKGMFVLTACIATAEAWAKFSDEWHDALTETGLKEFKSSHRPEHAPEFSGYFYRIAERHIHATACCAIPLGDLRAARDEIGFPARPGTENVAYMIAAKALSVFIIKLSSEGLLSDTVGFTFDNRQKEEKLVMASWPVMNASLPIELQNIAWRTPRFEKSEMFLPLQAADLFASWYRKSLAAGNLFGKKEYPFPWKIQRDYHRLVILYNKRSLRDVLKSVLETIKSDPYLTNHFLPNSYSLR